MLEASIKEKIAHEVIRVLCTRFDSFPVDQVNNRHQPFHEAFLQAFSNRIHQKTTCDLPYLISLASWLHGLNTTIGQTFFESTAHLLSGGSKQSHTTLRANLIYDTQVIAITELMQEYKANARKPSADYEAAIVAKAAKAENAQLIKCDPFIADVCWQTKTELVAIELKSVRPNAGESNGEKRKILMARAAMSIAYPDKKTSYLIGFPFDPTASEGSSSDKQRFLKSLINGERYFQAEEVLLGEELWDRLSGDNNAMTELIALIRKIATPDFLEHLNCINQYGSRSSTKGLKILQEWGLVSELSLKEPQALNAREQRVYFGLIFDESGKYIDARSQLIA